MEDNTISVELRSGYWEVIDQGRYILASFWGDDHGRVMAMAVATNFTKARNTRALQSTLSRSVH